MTPLRRTVDTTCREFDHRAVRGRPLGTTQNNLCGPFRAWCPGGYPIRPQQRLTEAARCARWQTYSSRIRLVETAMARSRGLFGPSERALEFGKQYAEVLQYWGDFFKSGSKLVAANV